jgi:hypothetical protein
MSFSRPVLGMLVTPNPPPAAERLLVALRSWCRPVAAEAGLNPVAWIATSPLAPGLGEAARSGKPLAVFAHDAVEVARALALHAATVLTTEAGLTDGDGVIVIGAHREAPADGVPAVPPFVRERLRRRSALPACLVVDFRSGDIPADLVAAALATCAACVVTGDLLEDALAWAAPLIIDRATATECAAGLRDGENALLREPNELVRAATELARDPVLAARLSRGARRLAESRSVYAAANIVAERLGLTDEALTGWRPRVDSVLRRLSTPASPLQPDVGGRVAPLDRPRATAAGGYS